VAGATSLIGFERRSAELRGARLTYHLGGAGRPLVLIHGLGGAAVNWVELAPELARDHRVLVPDLPGHAESPPLPVVAALAAFADRVALLAERLCMAPAIVVGHSLGGLVALRVALRRPTAVAGAVLAAAAGFSPSSRRAEQALLLSSLVRPGRLVAPYRRLVARSPLLRRLALGWGAADAAALAPRVVEGFLAGPALHSDIPSAARALIADDLRGRIHEVRCPVFVLWGARDTLTPVSDAFDYARRLDAELRVVADCGHLLIGERADACAAAIKEFSDRVWQLDERPVEAESLR
jgi:3-oxoadipate enol-lactonase